MEREEFCDKRLEYDVHAGRVAVDNVDRQERARARPRIYAILSTEVTTGLH